MPLNLIGSPPKPLLLIIIPTLTLFNLPSLALHLHETRRKIVTLVEEFSHLGEEDYVGEMQSTVLVVVAEVGIALLTHR